jgi:hypothetical protein
MRQVPAFDAALFGPVQGFQQSITLEQSAAAGSLTSSTPAASIDPVEGRPARWPIELPATTARRCRRARASRRQHDETAITWGNLPIDSRLCSEGV